MRAMFARLLERLRGARHPLRAAARRCSRPAGEPRARDKLAQAPIAGREGDVGWQASALALGGVTR